LAAVAAALWRSRDGLRVRPLLARVTQIGARIAMRLTPPTARWSPWAWVTAGIGFTANTVIVLAAVGEPGGAVHVIDRLAVGGAFVVLGWALLEARPRWELP